MSPLEIFFTALGMAAVTLLCRSFFLLPEEELPMPQWLRHHLLIVAVAIPVLFFRLGEARLWDRDEPRNARCAVEMLERADWIVPYFNDELRTHKPVLLYWLMMAAYAIFGVNEFAARFWSAALGVGTVLCTYHLGARLFNRQAGLWAALALTPALMFDVASRAATPAVPRCRPASGPRAR